VSEIVKAVCPHDCPDTSMLVTVENGRRHSHPSPFSNSPVCNELQRTGQQHGLVTVCAAGGMGVAMVLERE
jgi:hypothetical protein